MKFKNKENKIFIRYDEITGLALCNPINKTKLSSLELDAIMNCEEMMAGEHLCNEKI